MTPCHRKRERRQAVCLPPTVSLPGSLFSWSGLLHGSTEIRPCDPDRDRGLLQTRQHAVGDAVTQRLLGAPLLVAVDRYDIAVLVVARRTFHRQRFAVGIVGG